LPLKHIPEHTDVSSSLRLKLTNIQSDSNLLVSCLAYSSTINMEAPCSSEMSTHFQRTRRRHISEDNTLHKHRCENRKFHNLNLVSNLVKVSKASFNCSFDFSTSDDVEPGENRKIKSAALVLSLIIQLLYQSACQQHARTINVIVLARSG
jgi:hypothetical protein